MDSLSLCPNLIKKILADYERLYGLAPTNDVETFCVFDESRDHYILLEWGWNGPKRVKRILIYVRLKAGKIWIEEDRTEEGVVTDLLRGGVPASDIVLAFHPPQARCYTEFAVS